MLKGCHAFLPIIKEVQTNGITTIEKKPNMLMQSAAMLIDHKLNGPANRFRLLHQSIASDAKWPEKVHALFTQMYLATKLLESWESLNKSQQHDLTAFLGISLKKEDVLELKLTVGPTRWYAIGLNETKEDRLTVRKSYFINAQGQIALILDYIFGRAKVKALQLDKTYTAELFFYPGNNPQRAVINTLTRSHQALEVHGLGMDNLDSLREDIKHQLLENPLLTSAAFFVEDLELRRSEKEFLVVDKHGRAMPVELSESWFTRLALAAKETKVSLLLEWRRSGISVISAYCYHQLFTLD